MNNETYKKASVVITGIANMIVLILILFSIFKDSILGKDVYYEAVKWLTPLYTMTTPVLFAWVGVLLRWRFPNLSQWIKWMLLLIIPATYLLWTIVPVHDWLFWGTGYRCTCLYAGILSFLINPKHFGLDAMWSLMLFLSAVFIYIGVSRVVDHFSVGNWQMLTNEWTCLFRRLMTFIPLAMSIYFLVGFSFSSVGQTIGRCRTVGIISQVLAGIGMISYLASVIDPTFPYYINLLDIYRLLAQPVIVYLIVVLCRILRNGFKSPGIMHDIFKNITHQ